MDSVHSCLKMLGWIEERLLLRTYHGHQGMPPRSDWELWRKYLKLAVLSHDMHLKHPLGEWITDAASDTWYIDPRSDQLHRKLGSVWYFHSRIPRRSGRPMYSSMGTICDLPPVVHKAQVLYQNQYLICNGHCSIQAPVLPNRNSFMEFLFSSTEPSAHWCFESICLPLDDGYQLAQSIRNNLASINALKAVTDGSFKDTFGTAAWILECSETSQRMTGQVVAPGSDQDHSSYRSELSGVYAVLLVVSKLCSYFNVDEGSVVLGCDSQSALATAFAAPCYQHPLKTPCFDLL